MKHLEEYTTTPWLKGLSTESVTEYKVWGFLFYQAYRAKRKQGGRFKDGETRISTSNFDKKECAALLRRILTGTTELVESRNRSKFIGYSQLNQYLFSCLKLLMNQIDAVQDVISKGVIKSERVFMFMKMIQSRKVKDSRSAYKEKIPSAITPYQLVGGIQRI